MSADRRLLSADEVRIRLAALAGWSRQGDAIEKTWRFDDFHHTMAFVNALAWIAHAEDHHPDLSVGYGRCTVRFSTHSTRGITALDFHCAARTDSLLP